MPKWSGQEDGEREQEYGEESRGVSLSALGRLNDCRPTGRSETEIAAGRGKMVRSFPLARQKMYAAFLRCRVKRGAAAVFCRDSSAWTATVATEITLPRTRIPNTVRIINEFPRELLAILDKRVRSYSEV